MGAGLIVVEDRRWGLVIALLVSVLLQIPGLLAASYMLSPKHIGIDLSEREEFGLTPVVTSEEELRLGLNEAQSASIDWLGIQQPEAVVGEAVVSETDQAAQAVVVGESLEVATDEASVEPVEEAIEVAATDQVQESLDETDEVEELVEHVVQEETGQENEQAEVKQVEVSEVAQLSEAREAVIPKVAVVPAGEVGVLSEKEVVATRKERAIDVDPFKTNTPVVGEGLEIITVRPRYTSAVRLSAVPKNPIVVMWFDGEGKVSKAEFLREGKKLYSSGVVGVDEPLLNAIYQWRAKGKEIDALDEGDPKSLVEVSIRIVYQKERKGSSD